MDFILRVVRERHEDETVRGCLRALGTLAELHKAGYQRVRGMPFLSPSSMSWRLWISPVSHLHRNHGALRGEVASGPPGEAGGINNENLCAKFTRGQVPSGQFFGWLDIADDDTRGLAAKLVKRLPRLAEAGVGWDYEYVGWYQRLLGLAERGWLPEVFSDGYSPGSDAIVLADMRGDELRKREAGRPSLVLPLPPDGELQADSPELAPR